MLQPLRALRAHLSRSLPLPAWAKNMPPACFLNASRLTQGRLKSLAPILKFPPMGNQSLKPPEARNPFPLRRRTPPSGSVPFSPPARQDERAEGIEPALCSVGACTGGPHSVRRCESAARRLWAAGIDRRRAIPKGTAERSTPIKPAAPTIALQKRRCRHDSSSFRRVYYSVTSAVSRISSDS